MKLFCFSITFVLVNVLADNDADYNKEVAKTNKMIEQAFNMNDFTVGDNIQLNGLEYVIEKNANGVYSFAEINLMIAVPDKTDLIFHIPGNNFHCRLWNCFHAFVLRHIQDNMQREIGDTLDIDVPDDEVGQGVQSLNLTTLAEQRRRLVEIALKNIFKREIGSVYDQFIEQLEIRDTLNVEGLNLTALTENRRVTGRSLVNVIRRVLGNDVSEFDEDIEDQRSDNSEDEEEQNRTAHDPYLFRMCRLMGLYLSTKFPTSYIKELEIDPINYTCSLDDGIVQRRLKKINDVWWQISSTTSEVVNTI